METGTWQGFQDFSLWSLAIAWCRYSESKSLEIEHEGKKRSLHFYEGALIGATSQEPSENLAQVFLDDNVFTLEQYFQVSSSFDEDRSLAENLLASGLVTQSEVTVGEQECMFRILRGCLFIREGRFREIDLLDHGENENAALAMMPALFRAFLEFEDRDWVLQQYDQHLHIGIQQAAPFPENLWQTPGLEMFEKISHSFQEGILFRELVRDIGLPDFTLLKFVWMATQFGFLSRSMVVEAEPELSIPGDTEKKTDPGIVISESATTSIERPAKKGRMRRLLWLVGFLLLVAVGAWFWLGKMPKSASILQVEDKSVNLVMESPEEQEPEVIESTLPTVVPDTIVQAQNPGYLAMNSEDIIGASGYWKGASETWENQFTLGIYMACDPENVFVLWRELGGDEQFFVLPKTYEGRSCYWVCWGQFPSRLEALAARDRLPEALRDVAPDAEAYPIEKLY